MIDRRWKIIHVNAGKINRRKGMPMIREHAVLGPVMTEIRVVEDMMSSLVFVTLHQYSKSLKEITTT